MAFLMNAQLAVVILVVIPLLTAAIAVILKTAFPRFEIMQKKIDRLNSGIQEMLTNVRVIKSFVREDYEEENEDDILEEHFRRAYHSYSRRYEGYALKQKLIEKLMRDGFSYYTAKDFIEKQDL